MSQAVVIDYINKRGEREAQMIEPISIVWRALEGSAPPQWMLLAWVYPAGELLAFHMASIQDWTPVVSDDDADDAFSENAAKAGLSHRGA